MDLFDYMREQNMEKEAPLASRLRPTTLEEVVGQQHIIGKDKLLYRAIKADKLSSVIFYGPPGTGKTTLAKVIANTTSAEFTQINATTAGKKDMEEVIAKAKEMQGMYRKKTILFVDEIHRFNKGQQDYLLSCLLYTSTLREIPVGAAVEQHFKDIGHDPEDHSVTYENSQARERTQVLMDVANQTGGIVIGTGDMSELALGWATYNGDHMSMYGVNASVPKTLVRHLVHYYADTCKDQELKDVLYDVLDTPVSPELLPPKDGEIAQKTEDLVGPYELHDFFLYYLLRFSYEPGKIYRIARYAFDGEYDDATIYKWLYTCLLYTSVRGR